MRSTLVRFVTASLLVLVLVDVLAVAGEPIEGGGSKALADVEAQGTTAGPPISELATVEGFDEVQIHVQVAADRSATWRVQYRYRLDDANAERAFDRARENVSNPPGVFVERMSAAAERAERRTGREMAVRNGSVGTFRSIPHGRFGVVEYRFTWTGFAASDDGSLVVGDAVAGFPLEANETLVFDWETGMEVVEVTPPPNATSESAVRWEGPHEFGVDAPRLVLAKSGGSVIATPTGTLAVAAVLAVALVAVLGFGVGTDRITGAFGAGSTAEDAGTEPASETPPELLSDEERVIGLLEANGGRMKQQEVKEELDWSRTKTSNVVNDLQDADKIEVYRLGRENTLALPGEIDV